MKNINESGRSMVEMLGVLAIIGVLSIGGIAGYTMAMNRYRANEVIDTASKFAIIAMTNPQKYDNLAAADLPADPAGTGCTMSVAAATAGQGVITLAGCTGKADLITAINSIAGDKFSTNTNTFRFDGQSAGADKQADG